MTLPSKSDLALYQKLHRRSVRQAEGLWLVEGPNAVLAALRAHITPVCILVKTPDLLANLPAMAQVVPDTILARMASTDSPPPMVGIFRAQDFTTTNAVINPPKAPERWLMLDGLQDPGNVGTLIRCLRAFNAFGLVVTPDTVDVYSPKVIRASAGEVFFTPIYPWQPNDDLDMPVYATRAHDATPFQQVDWTQGGLLVLGQEGNGVNLNVLPSGTKWISVPQNPAVDSLNVAVTGAIIMAQWAEIAI